MASSPLPPGSGRVSAAKSNLLSENWPWTAFLWAYKVAFGIVQILIWHDLVSSVPFLWKAVWTIVSLVLIIIVPGIFVGSCFPSAPGRGTAPTGGLLKVGRMLAGIMMASYLLYAIVLLFDGGLFCGLADRFSLDDWLEWFTLADVVAGPIGVLAVFGPMCSELARMQMVSQPLASEAASQVQAKVLGRTTVESSLRPIGKNANSPRGTASLMATMGSFALLMIGSLVSILVLPATLIMLCFVPGAVLGYRYVKQQKVGVRESPSDDVRARIVRKAVDVVERSLTGLTPLHLAARNGRKDVAELLIEKGAQVEAKDRDGRTPLHWAGGTGHKDVVELLLAKGANVGAMDGNDWTPFHASAAGGSKDVTELLITKGSQIEAKDVEGRTPLHWAASMGHKDVAELLMAKGAQVGVKTNNGLTPLHLAARNGYKDVAELLLEKGTQINDRTKDGQTPLGLAIQNEKTEMAEFLKSRGGEE